MKQIAYNFSSKIWQHQSPGGWFFVSLPEHHSKEIRNLLGDLEEGWGRLKAQAQIEDTKWETAIWFDTKHKTYILPLKAAIRKQLQLEAGQTVKITIFV